MNQLYQIVSYIVPMLLSLTVHEYSHARVAWWLGDDTASSQGRLTFNPLAHADPIGTFLLPIVAQLSGNLPLIGWAKPVPINPQRFTRRFSMQTGIMLTSIAGPLSNLLLMFLSVAALRILSASTGLGLGELFDPHSRAPVNVGAHLLLILSFMNAGLCVFNLIPIPPLDGSRLLPRALQPYMASLRSVSYFLLMAIVFFAGRIITVPIAYLLYGAFGVFGLPNEWLLAMARA